MRCSGVAQMASPPPRRKRIYFPCRCCFLECEPRNKAVLIGGGHGPVYPCSAELRVWARAHRNDKCDEKGFVWGVT